MDNVNDENSKQMSAITRSIVGDFVGRAPSLTKRGLESLQHLTLTQQHIRETRDNTKAFKGLSDAVIRIIIERPSLWEYFLFFQVLLEQISASETIIYNREMGSLVHSSEELPIEDAYDWFQERLSEYTILLNQIGQLIKDEFLEAAGLPGVSGDPVALVVLARRCGLTFLDASELALRVKRVECDSIFDELFARLSYAFQELALDIQRYCLASVSCLDEVQERIRERGNLNKSIEVTLKFTVTPTVEALYDEIKRFQPLYMAHLLSLMP